MKTAMIWGAAGGIGRALVERLAADGWTVIAVARHGDGLDDLTPHVLEADVSNAYEVQRAVMEAAQAVDAIDLWVYAAGDIASAPITEMDYETWQRILVANLSGAFLSIQQSEPLLAEDAHIVLVGAVSERLRLPGLAAYASAKAGIEALADVLRKEQRKRRVTLVRPGAVATPLWDKVPLRVPSDAMTPGQVAEKIVSAYHDGHKGNLDLTH